MKRLRPMSDKEADDLVAELATEGISVTREQAQSAVHRVADVLLQVRREQHTWKPPSPEAWEAILRSLAEAERAQGRDTS